MATPSVHIIVINWNGWHDTLECLNAVLDLDYPSFRAVVVDNGSRDNSCDRIRDWARGNSAVRSSHLARHHCRKPITVVVYDRSVAEGGGDPRSEQSLEQLSAPDKLVLIQSEENLGFAGGCNVAIRYALAAGTDYVWLLNNDAVPEPAALGRLVDFLQSHPGYQGVTGQIRLYDDPSVIWNCGGTLTWYGSRRYHYATAPAAAAPQQGFRRVTFVTGCAALFRASLFKQVGMLSNRFFFGEEDFELCLRLKRRGYRLACRYDAIVYHKVGASIDAASQGKVVGKAYLYYLNRFIDLRGYWPRAVWLIWRSLYLMYIIPMLRLKHKIPWHTLWLLRKSLLKNSKDLQEVDRHTFQRVLNSRLEGLD